MKLEAVEALKLMISISFSKISPVLITTGLDYKEARKTAVKVMNNTKKSNRKSALEDCGNAHKKLWKELQKHLGT